MSKNKGEPTLEKIDDYNGNETRQKRVTIRLVIVLLLVVGAILAYMQEPAKQKAIEVQEKTSIPAK